jgi:hypothetical protein
LVAAVLAVCEAATGRGDDDIRVERRDRTPREQAVTGGQERTSGATDGDLLVEEIEHGLTDDGGRQQLVCQRLGTESREWNRRRLDLAGIASRYRRHTRHASKNFTA